MRERIDLLQDRGIAREGIEVALNNGVVVGRSGGMWSLLQQGESCEVVGLCIGCGSCVLRLLLSYTSRMKRQSNGSSTTAVGDCEAPTVQFGGYAAAAGRAATLHWQP
ncbi:unnamed protein product [Prunus armeniaca]|uniref:Uncharacterized protein n=1 Tax=Prunus armeniaca TaxID=36596 RepID=A0A6J5UQ62_PRUAR|nr:unnamed protein product [Prunus armeniaca]